jgi:uncharacterized membrane protein
MRNDLGTSESRVTALGLLQGAFARLGYIFTTLDCLQQNISIETPLSWVASQTLGQKAQVQSHNPQEFFIVYFLQDI